MGRSGAAAWRASSATRTSIPVLVEGAGSDWVVTLARPAHPGHACARWRERLLAEAETADAGPRRADRGQATLPGLDRGGGRGRGDEVAEGALAADHRGDEDAERGPRPACRAGHRGGGGRRPGGRDRRRAPAARVAAVADRVYNRWPMSDARAPGGAPASVHLRHRDRAGLRAGRPRRASTRRPSSASPGSFPFTRGIHADGYRGRPWTMRQYAGFGSAEETNRRFRYLLERGQTGLSRRLRPADADRLRLGRPDGGRRGRPGRRADRLDRRHGDRCSTASTSAR